MKVVDAIGAQLDWMVAKCAGYVEQGVYGTPEFRDGEVYLCYCDVVLNSCYSPTTDWAQAGPILEREGINLSVDYQDDALSDDMVQIGWKGNLWNNSVPGTAGFLQWAYGPTPLIAAMRCFCSSKLGDEVDVPEELM